MLLLVTIGLVLVGAVSLVIGFVSNSLGPIYLSIVCSVIAGIVLILFSRMAKRQGALAGAGGAPPGAAPVGLAAPEAERATEAVHVLPGGAPDGEFPIADYDDLRVNQILPLLGELDPDELAQVRAREARGRNRGTILARIDQAARSAASREEAPAAVAAAPAARPASSGNGTFPIADYDDLKVGEIIPLLDELDDDELEMVAEREEQGRNRAAVIGRIDAIFGEPAPAPAARRAAPRRAAARRAAARKAAARRAPAKKAVARRAAPAKRAAPRRAAARRAAPAKKRAAGRRR